MIHLTRMFQTFHILTKNSPHFRHICPINKDAVYLRANYSLTQAKRWAYLSNCPIYQFCSEGGKVRQYQQSKSPEDKKKPGNSSLQGRRAKADKFIHRIISYSNFLKRESNMRAQMAPLFTEAGTNIDQISQSLSQIASGLEKILNLHKETSISLKNTIRYEELIKLVEELDQEHYKQTQLQAGPPIDSTLFLLDLQSEMDSLMELLNGAIEGKNPNYKSDITGDEPFSRSFEYAWKNVNVIKLDASTKAKHDTVYNMLRKSVVMVTNAVVTEHTFSDWDNQYWHKIIFGLSFPFSLASLKKAELRCYKLWRRPTIEMAKHLLDLPEKGYIQHAKKIIYPLIKSNFFLYTPKQTTGNQSKGQETSSNIFQKSENSGRILVNSHENLHFKSSRPAQKFPLLRKIMSLGSMPTQNPETQQETIIIHVHGGGFIAMSSELMQNHTRKWANQLKIPIFSLDYRKPPRHRFPEPLEDCVAGYKFIVEQIHKHMNIKPKNVILAGDSAGGNLVCALNAQLMKQKYPILPKGLFLMYPAVDLRIRYTASRLQSFSDGIFRPSLLMLCQKEYLGQNGETELNPLASPILLKQSFINSEKEGTPEGEKWPRDWPRTVIMSGRKDPLFDDSIRLVERLSRDNLECKMLLYKDFSHGFMSMDQVLPGAKQAIKDSITQLKAMIQKIQKNERKETVK